MNFFLCRSSFLCYYRYQRRHLGVRGKGFKNGLRERERGGPGRKGEGDGKLSNMLLLWLICFPIGMLFSCVVYKFLGLQNEWDDLL